MTQKKINDKRRQDPQRLGEKLKMIRLHHSLSQSQMILVINPQETGYNRARISQYEKGKRMPSLIETLNYAKFARVHVEVLIDDDLELVL